VTDFGHISHLLMISRYKLWVPWLVARLGGLTGEQSKCVSRDVLELSAVVSDARMKGGRCDWWEQVSFTLRDPSISYGTARARIFMRNLGAHPCDN